MYVGVQSNHLVTLRYMYVVWYEVPDTSLIYRKRYCVVSLESYIYT